MRDPDSLRDIIAPNQCIGFLQSSFEKAPERVCSGTTGQFYVFYRTEPNLSERVTGVVLLPFCLIALLPEAPAGYRITYNEDGFNGDLLIAG